MQFFSQIDICTTYFTVVPGAPRPEGGEACDCDWGEDGCDCWGQIASSIHGAIGENHNNFVKNAIFLENRYTTYSTVVPGAAPPEGGFAGGCVCNCEGDDDDCDCALLACGASSISNGISLL